MSTRGTPDTVEAQIADIYERLRRQARRIRQTQPAPGGVFYIQIAASDASQHSKDRADYVCGGYDNHRIDHVIVQKVVDAFSLPEIQSDGGGTILLSEGTFWFGDSVIIRHDDGSSGARIAILGLGAHTEVTSSTINAATTINDAADVAHTDSYTIRSSASKDRVRIEGIHFVGPGKTPAAGVASAIGGAAADVTSCSFEDYTTAIDASGMGSFWSRCAARDCGTGFYTAGTNGAHISSCYSSCDVGYRIGSGSGDQGFAIVENCVADVCGIGIYVTGSNAVIVGNHILARLNWSGGPPKGIYVDGGSRNVIASNRIWTYSSGTNGAVGIHVLDGSVANIVHDNNLIVGYGDVTPTADGIRIGGDQTSVQGNTIRRGTTALTDVNLRYGINIEGTADRTVCTDNDLYLSGQTADYTDAGTLTSGNCGVPVTRSGTGVLVAGVLTVNTAMVTANSRIFLTSQVDGGTPGFLRVTARVAGTSFTVTSSSVADTSTFAWEIIEP